MDFGKLPAVDKVDFRLPPDPPANAARLAQAAALERPRSIDIGTAGWGDKRFVGKLYPEDARAKDFLAHYSRAFPTNELNSTYYGVDPARIAVWTETVPDGFRFCPKLPSTVTHEKELEHVDADMESFLKALETFGDHLGCVWSVLPPAFGPSRAHVLGRFVESWARRVPLALELRHPSWFTSPAALDEVFALFEAHGVVAVLNDVAGRRDVLHMRLTAPDTMVRFVGNALHPTDFTRLDTWIERLGSWFDAGLRHTWFFLHQPDDHHTVELYDYLAPRLEARTGLDLGAWRRNAPALPGERQLGLF